LKDTSFKSISTFINMTPLQSLKPYWCMYFVNGDKSYTLWLLNNLNSVLYLYCDACRTKCSFRTYFPQIRVLGVHNFMRVLNVPIAKKKISIEKANVCENLRFILIDKVPS